MLYLRRQYHLGAIRIMWYVERYHAVKISESTVTRILRRHGLRRLPQRSGRRAVHTRRYNKQVPGHHIQIDVKFLTFIGNDDAKIKRYQYTAIDDVTRVRALQIYDRHNQKNDIHFVNHVIENSFFVSSKSVRTAATSSRRSFIGMWMTWVFVMCTSKPGSLNYMARWKGHTALIKMSSTSYFLTKMIKIYISNWPNGSSFTIFPGHMALTSEKHLTKP